MENRLVTETSQGSGAQTWFGYDPWGHRVMEDVNPYPGGYQGEEPWDTAAWQFYFYGIDGKKLTTMWWSPGTG